MENVALSDFPKVHWSAWNADVEFLPCEVLPVESRGRLYAVIVHAFFGDKILMADIVGRGVCVPSGRINPGETVDEAVVRETYEETGAELHSERRRLIGCYRMTRRPSSPEPLDAPARVFYSPVVIADVTQIGPIPVGSESRGFFLLNPEDVADQYFMWDDLLAAAFSYAWEERNRLFPAGVPLAGGMHERFGNA